MKERDYIKVEFPSKSSNESLARSIAGCIAAQMDPTLEELEDIRTAVSEAVTNCTVHAYPEEIGRIQMKCRVYEDGELEIRIRDWGCGIGDIAKAREPLYTTGGEERSGMGFSIMDSFMDGLRVRSKKGKGTTVIMRKKVSRKREQ